MACGTDDVDRPCSYLAEPLVQGDEISMLDTAVNIVAAFAVVILVILLLDTTGGYIGAHIPAVAGVVRQTLYEVWGALQRIAQAANQH
jgi:ABC-type methionine transport system permease subunit